MKNSSISHLEDSFYDIAVALSDELPKARSKEMGQWIVDVFSSQVQSNDRLRRLLPFPEKNLLQGLIVRSESDSTAEVSCARPWEYIEYGINTSCGEALSWPDPIGIADLNDTCISLAHFGARKIRPRRNTFQALYEYGWRSDINVEKDMELDSQEEPFLLELDKVESRSRKRSADSMLESEAK